MGNNTVGLVNCNAVFCRDFNGDGTVDRVMNKGNGYYEIEYGYTRGFSTQDLTVIGRYVYPHAEGGPSEAVVVRQEGADTFKASFSKVGQIIGGERLSTARFFVQPKNTRNPSAPLQREDLEPVKNNSN